MTLTFKPEPQRSNVRLRSESRDFLRFAGNEKKNVDLKVPSKLINITKPYIWTIWLSKYVYHGNANFPVQWHDIPNRSPDITVDKLEKTVNVSISIVHSPGLNRTKELWIVMRINMSKMFQCSHLMLFFFGNREMFLPMLSRKHERWWVTQV